MNKNLKKLLSAICALTVTFSSVSVPVSAEEFLTDTAADAAEFSEAAEKDGASFDELERIEGTSWETTFTDKDGFLTWTDPDTSLYPVNPNPELWECIAEYELFVNGTRMYQPITQFDAEWSAEANDNVLNGKIRYAQVYLPAIISKYVRDGGDTTNGATVTIKAHKTPKDSDTSVVIDSCTTTFDASKYIGSKSDALTTPIVSARAEMYDGAANCFFMAGGTSNAAAYVFEYENVSYEGSSEYDYVETDTSGSVEFALWWISTNITPDIRFKAYAVDKDGNYGELSQEVTINHTTGKVTKAVPEKIASLPTWDAHIEYDYNGGYLGADQAPGGNTTNSDNPYGVYYYIFVDPSGNIAATIKTHDEWYDFDNGKFWSDKVWRMPAPIITGYNIENPGKALSGTYELYVGFGTEQNGKVEKISDSSMIISYTGGNKVTGLEQPGVKQSDVHYENDNRFVSIDLPECNDDTKAQGYIVQYIFSVDTDRNVTEFVQGGCNTNLWFDGEQQDINVRILPVDGFGGIGEWEEITVSVGVPVEKWDPQFKYDEKTGELSWTNVVTDIDHGYSYKIYDAKSGFESFFWVDFEWNDEQQKDVLRTPVFNLPEAFAQFAVSRGESCEGTYDLTLEAYIDDKQYKASSKFTYTYGGLSTDSQLKPKVLFASAHFDRHNTEFPYYTEIYMGAQNEYTKENAVGYVYKFDVESDGYTGTKEKPTTVTVCAVSKTGQISEPVTAAVLDDIYPESGLIYDGEFDQNIQWDRWQYSKQITDWRYNDLFDITKAAKFEFVLRPTEEGKLSDSFGGAVIINSDSKGWNQKGFWGVDDPENGLFATVDENNVAKIVPGTEKGTYVISADISDGNPYYGLDNNISDPEYVSMNFMIWANDENPAFTGTSIKIEQANIYDKDGNLLIRFDNGGHAFAAPEYFNLDDGNEKVYLSFAKVFGADHYDIYQDGVKIKTLEQTDDYEINYVVEGLENDHENGYNFKVAAVSKDGIEKFTEELNAYPNSWTGVGISYLDKNNNWQWISGPAEGKDFANIDEATAFAASLGSKNINIIVRGREETLKNLKALPAGVESFGIGTNPEGKLTISAKSISVPDGAAFFISGNTAFSGKTTISAGKDCGLDISSSVQQDAKSAVTIKGKNSGWLNINGMTNIAAVSGFDSMNIYGSKISGAIKGAYLDTADTTYNSAVTLTGDLNNGWNSTFAKAVKADGNIMINGATVKGALTSAGTVDAYFCTLGAVSITGKKLASLKWDDGNDIIAVLENCTTGKITSELKTFLRIAQCKVNGAVTSKGGLHIETYDTSDPTTITGAVTAAAWLNIIGSNVTGKVTASEFISISDSTVKGALTGKAGMLIEDSTVDSVNLTGRNAEDALTVRYSTINGKLSSAAAPMFVNQSDIKGAVTAKGAFEFYGIEGETPVSVIGGAVNISGKDGKSVIYNAKVAGKITAAKDLEIGSIIAEKGVTAKGTLIASTSEVHDAVTAEILSTSWGGLLKFTALTVSKGGFVKSKDNPDIWLGLELITKTGSPVALTPGTKNNVVAKKFVGSFDGLFLSDANCKDAQFKVEKNKLIVI